MKIRPTVVIAVLLVTGACTPAGANTTFTTKYAYYAVGGSTPRDIYAAILRRGPRVGGTKALAATTADAVAQHSVLQSPSACEVVDFKVTFNFTVSLPSISNEHVLPPQDRQLWQQFTEFLKRHELHHIKLWLGCADDLEQRVRALRMQSCDDLTRKADELWKHLKTSCGEIQASFDEEQRTELLQQPFLRKVMRGAQR